VVSEPLMAGEADAALSKAIPALDRHLADHGIEILTTREWYLKEGRFEAKRVLDAWHAKLKDALRRGFEGMRVSSDLFWADQKRWRSLCAYERELDASIAGQPMTVLCTHPLARRRASDVLDVARTHQFTAVKRKGDWEIVETPELKQAKEEIRRLNEELEQRVAERTRELEAVNAEFRAQIAERKRIEEELRRSEAHLAEAQRLTHTSSWTWNPATGRLQWSQEHFHIFGFDPEKGEPSYEGAVERIHPEDRPQFKRAVEQAVRAGSDVDNSFRVALPDGSIRYCRSLGHPTVNESGEIEYVGTVMDVTERMRAEEALRDAQAELARVTRITGMGELAASIAHEINQPLAAVITNSDAALRWLANHPPNLEETREALKRTIRDANRASEVIKRFRALLTKDKPERLAVDINDAVNEVLLLTRSEQQRHQIKVETELAQDLPPVQGDRVQLQQVMLNLILNGIEAMSTVADRPRVLRIRSRMSDTGGLLVAVEDTGVGIDPANMDRLFNPFFTTKSGGMGMGLAISRSIVEAHGGRLWATPASPHGTVFQFTLPRAEASTS
jgi:PAS domain S-box-containing protein